MGEAEMRNGDTGKEKGPKEIAHECMDSPGYVLFCAKLLPQRNNQGQMTIDYQYRRYHFPLEDARGSVDVLRGFVEKELEDLIRQYGSSTG